MGSRQIAVCREFSRRGRPIQHCCTLVNPLNASIEAQAMQMKQFVELLHAFQVLEQGSEQTYSLCKQFTLADTPSGAPPRRIPAQPLF